MCEFDSHRRHQKVYPVFLIPGFMGLKTVCSAGLRLALSSAMILGVRTPASKVRGVISWARSSARTASCIVPLIILGACARGIEDQDEYAQVVGDLMSALDEASGSESGAYALLHDGERGEFGPRISVSTLSALSSSCLGVAFSSCSNGSKAREFESCTLGLGQTTLTGSISLLFSEASCSMSNDGAWVTRMADFILIGRRGATLSVSSPGGGQTVTRTATGFSYSVGGMKRVLADASGNTLAEIETRTLSPITINGPSRAERVMTGGGIEIKNKTRGTSLVLTPFNLTWKSSCNCAVSGVLTGTASGTEESSFAITITGCGTANVEAGSQKTNLTFDLCAGV